MPGPQRGTHHAQSSILTRRKAAELMANGESPLDGLVDEFRWWKRETLLLEGMMREKMKVEGFKSILQLERIGAVLNFFEAKKELRDSYLAAAPWVHPRLAAKKPTEADDDVGARELAAISDDDLNRLIEIGRKMTAASGASAEDNDDAGDSGPDAA